MIPTAMLPITNAVLLFSWCSMMLGGTVVVLDCSDCEYFLCASINRAKPSRQSTAPMYPELPTEDGQNYRLQKISEIEQNLIKEGRARKPLYKKYKQAINITDSIDTVLVSACVFMSGLGITIPIVLLPLEVAAAYAEYCGYLC